MTGIYANDEAYDTCGDAGGQRSSPCDASFTRVIVRPGGGRSIGTANHPALSADGRFVAFASAADNLVTGDSNSATDVFLTTCLP